ncbi:hypothetical protein APED_23885 [Acanthopleuribacter pedis]
MYWSAGHDGSVGKVHQGQARGRPEQPNDHLAEPGFLDQHEGDLFARPNKEGLC